MGAPIRVRQAAVGRGGSSGRGTQLGAWADSSGRFILKKVPVGDQFLECTHIGFDVAWRNVVVEAGTRIEVEIRLGEAIIPLRAITISPSRFAIMGQDGHARQTLTEEEIQTLPHMGEDVYRAVTRLPGISGNDYSAKFTVRGGEHEEVLVLLDGLELNDPFHLKDINGGVLSIVDVVAIEGIDLLTGAFPAEYGNRTSGVFDITTRSPRRSDNRYSLGVSLMNARALSQGTFDRGAWLLSARRGYLDLVLQLMNEEEELDPKYYDLLGKVEYELDPAHRLSAHVLHASDRLDLVEDDGDIDNTRYGNSYVWLNLQSFPSTWVAVESTLSLGVITTDRVGTAFLDEAGEFPDFTVDDDRRFRAFGLRQDWSYERSERQFLKWGLEVQRLMGSYEYATTDTWYVRVRPDSVPSGTVRDRVETEPAGTRLGLHFADRVRLGRRLAVEAGLRYDRASHTGDNLLSPRLNLVYNLGASTSIRGGWGHYYQSDGIDGIDVEDGERSFHRAERARHRVLGFHHQVGNILLRAEAYDKKKTDQHPSYRNWLNEIEPFPEMLEDRYRVDLEETTSRGVEVYAKRDAGGKLTWWASYAIAQVEEEVNRVTVADSVDWALAATLPGVHDQRHTIYFDLNYRPSRRWHLNLAWQFRSGWPFTEKVLQSGVWEDGTEYLYTTAGEPQGSRYPAFHRFDLRLSRRFETVSRGRISTYLELVNLYNRGNVRTYEYYSELNDQGEWRLKKQPEFWFRLLPSIGLTWSWGALETD